MRQLPKFTEKYFFKFSELPVSIKPYNAKSKIVAEKYINKLRKSLDDYPDIIISHRGSTALGISGKGDIEIGVYPTKSQWENVIKQLSIKYKGIGNLENEYARFNDEYDGFEIEVILMKGYTAELDRKLSEYLANNRHVLIEYETIKKRFSYSKREYQIQKDQFFRKIIELIPDS